MNFQLLLRAMEIMSATTAAIAAYMAHRSAREAMRLASLAMERVSSSRASRFNDASASVMACLVRNQSSTELRNGELCMPCKPRHISSRTFPGPLASSMSYVDLSN